MLKTSEAIKDFMNAVKFKKTNNEEPVYECSVCKDSGIIISREKILPEIKICVKCSEKWKMRRMFKESGITEYDYRRYTLEKFVTDTQEAIEMKELANRFLADKNAKGIGFFGNSGTGKTHICIAICQAMKRTHYYWQYRREIQKIKNAMYTDGNEYEKLMKTPTTANILYIDDLFKDAWDGIKLSNQDAQIMFQIINERYIKQLKTIISSEYSLNKIYKSNEAIGSRIYEMIKPYLMKVEGENRRIRWK